MNATRYLPFVGRLLIGFPFAMSGIRQTRRLRSHSREDRCSWPAGASGGLRRSRCRRARRWTPADCWLSGSRDRNCVGTVLVGDSSVLPRQLRRPESDDSLPQKRHAGRWPASDRGLRRGSDQCRQPPFQRPRGCRDGGASRLIRFRCSWPGPCKSNRALILRRLISRATAK